MTGNRNLTPPSVRDFNIARRKAAQPGACLQRRKRTGFARVLTFASPRCLPQATVESFCSRDGISYELSVPGVEHGVEAGHGFPQCWELGPGLPCQPCLHCAFLMGRC